MSRGNRGKKEAHLVNEMEKDARTDTSRVVENKTPISKRAELVYRVLQETEEGSLVEIHLLTGRHHQNTGTDGTCGNAFVRGYEI